MNGYGEEWENGIGEAISESGELQKECSWNKKKRNTLVLLLEIKDY